MKFKDHLIIYLVACSGFLLYQIANAEISVMFIVGMLTGFFIMNPHIQIEQHEKNIRSAITHSVLFPVIVYWGLHYFWSMDSAKLLGIVLFYPILVHIAADFSVDHLQTDEEKYISFFGYVFTKEWSIAWMAINIGALITYIVWALQVQ